MPVPCDDNCGVEQDHRHGAGHDANYGPGERFLRRLHLQRAGGHNRDWPGRRLLDERAKHLPPGRNAPFLNVHVDWPYGQCQDERELRR